MQPKHDDGYVNDTGLPSPSDILYDFIPASIRQYFTDEVRDRGRTVHAALHSYAMTGFAIPIREDWQGYVESGKKWLDEWCGKVVLVEERLMDVKRGFCGKLDLAIVTKDDRPMVPDWKTSASEGSTWRLQIAAYGHLMIVNNHDFADYGSLTVCALRLNRGGKIAQMYDYTASFSADLEMFAKALRAYQLRAEVNGYLGL